MLNPLLSAARPSTHSTEHQRSLQSETPSHLRQLNTASLVRSSRRHRSSSSESKPRPSNPSVDTDQTSAVRRSGTSKSEDPRLHGRFQAPQLKRPRDMKHHRLLNSKPHREISQPALMAAHTSTLRRLTKEEPQDSTRPSQSHKLHTSQTPPTSRLATQ